MKQFQSVNESVVVSLSISKLACTELIFVELGTKINAVYMYYRDVFLQQKLLPVIRKVPGNDFVFSRTVHQHTTHMHWAWV